MQLRVTKPLDDHKEEVITKLKDEAYKHITETLPITKQINLLVRYIDLKTLDRPLSVPEKAELDQITKLMDWKNDIIDEVTLAEDNIRKASTHHTVRGIREVATSFFKPNPRETKWQ